MKTKNNYLYVFCFFTTIIVFIFFIHTLGYSWKHYDEKIIYGESILPIPKSFSEIFEIISLLGIHNHFEASNTFYSNISNIRGTPVDVILNLFIFSFFKKSAFAYHLFSLILHLFNTILCFLILNKIIGHYLNNAKDIPRLFLISLITLLWSLHPANVESVLFATNYGALITYFFCFLFLYYFISSQLDISRKTHIRSQLILFLLYLFPLFLNEYSVTLPIILFSYLFASLLFNNKELSPVKAFGITIQRCLPMFFALGVYAIYFLSLPTIRTTQESSLVITLERTFWLSPQIFLHYLKLIVYPKNLSIDQSFFVQIGNHLFEPYSIFCCLLTYFLLLMSVASLFLIKKSKFYFLFFITFIPFYFSILPFLHVLSPIYNIASERYLYFPLFLLVFGLSHILSFSYLQFEKSKKVILTVLLVCLISSGIQSYKRTFDWKDSFTLLSSAINNAPNSLAKGLREEMLSTAIKIFNPQGNEENIKHYNEKAISSLKEALKELENKKIQYQVHIPDVLKFYGLDPKTLIAKTNFLLAFSDYELNKDPGRAVNIFGPYLNKLDTLDTNILNFYYRMLFITKDFNSAEAILLKNLNRNRISPQLFLALSDILEYKYNDLKETEKYLNLSFKYFPYDSLTLFGLKRFYQNANNSELFAHYSYLFGIRMHDSVSLQQAAFVYLLLNKKDIASRIIKKLQKDYPIDQNTLILERKYKEHL